MTDVAACLLALPCFLCCCAVCACPCPIAVHADCWSRAGLDHTPLFSVIPFFPTGFLMVDCHASFFCISVLYAMQNKQIKLHHIMLLFRFFISFYQTQVSLGSGLWVPVSLSPRPLVETLLHFLHSSAYCMLCFRTIVRSVPSSHECNFQHIFVLFLDPFANLCVQQIYLAGTLYKTHRCNYLLLHCLLLLCDRVSIKYNE